MSVKDESPTLSKLVSLLRWHSEYLIIGKEYKDFYSKCADLIEQIQARCAHLERYTEVNGLSLLMYKCEELERENKLLRGGVAEYATFEEDDAK